LLPDRLRVIIASVAEVRMADDPAPLAERAVWKTKVRPLEGVMDYATTWL